MRSRLYYDVRAIVSSIFWGSVFFVVVRTLSAIVEEVYGL